MMGMGGVGSESVGLMRGLVEGLVLVFDEIS